MEENMDPPSFTKLILKQTLQIEDGFDQVHKIMEEKAGKIEQKLTKIEDEALEESKLTREGNQFQLVPVQNNIGYTISASTAVSLNN
jgi:hypothetical protein